MVRKVAGTLLKIVHIRPSPEVGDDFRNAIDRNKELGSLLNKCKFELITPITALHLMNQIPTDVSVCLYSCKIFFL